MRKRKNKKIWFMSAMITLIIVGSVFAYFQKTVSIDNKFRSKEAKVYLNEKFDPDDRWVPGEEKQKEVRFGNEGEIEAVLRVRFISILKGQDGEEDKQATEGFKLNFSEDFDTDWVKSGDWYYYKKTLSSGELTDVTLKSVTISDEIGNDEHGISKDYSNAVYDVKIEGELLQASLAKEAADSMNWGLTPTVTGKNVIWIND